VAASMSLASAYAVKPIVTMPVRIPVTVHSAGAVFPM
jgi:hypothetical protein